MVASLSYILPKYTKTREHEDEHCVLHCTYIGYYVHDPISLDNPKNHTALPYIAISPYNHGSLKAERHIRTISEMIAKQLTGKEQIWTHYLQTCTYA